MRLRERGRSVPPTPVSVSVTRPAAETPASDLQVIVTALNRTLGSDARTERALRLLRPILFAGVLAVVGIAFIVVAVSAMGTWWSLVYALGLTVVSAGTAIVRRRWRRDPSPASVVAPTPREAATTRQGRHRKPPLREQSPSNRAGAGGRLLCRFRGWVRGRCAAGGAVPPRSRAASASPRDAAPRHLGPASLHCPSGQGLRAGRGPALHHAQHPRTHN